MFRFFHTYHPQTWEATVRAGLVGADDGLRCMQHVFLKDDEKFNAMMAKGSPFRAMLEESGMPFYFDRLLGGIFFDENYRYDMALVNEVKERFGDSFFGFQIHEWGSNYLNDWLRLQNTPIDEWTPKGIREGLCRKHGGAFPWVESHSSAEFAAMRQPQNATEFVQHMKSIYRNRATMFGDLLIPADSFFMAPRIEIQNGAKYLMPEVGWQVANMRVQVAYTRGMARAAGIPWGVYYEPWGGEPFGVTSNNVGHNEWNLSSNGVWMFEMLGEKGGSSRLLQDRIYRYAYASGASFISEEWGLCNTFLDWEDFELSQYGKVKLEFLKEVRSDFEIGAPYTPIAVVLPADLEVFDLWLLAKENTRYLGFPMEESKKCQYEDVAEGLRALFGDSSQAHGNEAHVIKNGGMPDVFDILHADHEEALSHYDYLIDLTGDASFAQKHTNVVKLDDLENLLRSILPCWVDGGVHWMLNRVTDGYRLMIFNHNGIDRSVAFGDRFLKEADLTGRIDAKGTLRLLNSSRCDFRTDGQERNVALSAGGYATFVLSQ